MDGCYWHGCPEHCRVPTSNNEYWTAKIGRNQKRDDETTRVLKEAGWTVLRFWEHDSPDDAARVVVATVRERAATRG